MARGQHCKKVECPTTYHGTHFLLVLDREKVMAEAFREGRGTVGETSTHCNVFGGGVSCLEAPFFLFLLALL